MGTLRAGREDDIGDERIDTRGDGEMAAEIGKKEKMGV